LKWTWTDVCTYAVYTFGEPISGCRDTLIDCLVNYIPRLFGCTFEVGYRRSRERIRKDTGTWLESCLIPFRIFISCLCGCGHVPLDGLEFGSLVDGKGELTGSVVRGERDGLTGLVGGHGVRRRG
jgi:hypothetical protein